ncbi:HD domain-containing protein [Geotalea sp. SG265]|uniref:HD domain-containing protein n=1 Tax=Geotalea sp. SG265 TaxID=2922867 RepID=UPI001FAFFB07|nr:HD domain-containing protein [Geotalea sp. SG265]
MLAGDFRNLLEKWHREGLFDLLLPEVAALRGVPQPEDFHKEGDAFTHTMLALAAVDDLSDGRVFWGVLLHDIGKAATTEFIKGRWRAYGHDNAGAAKVSAIMSRLGLPELGADVAWLVKHHHFHFSWQVRGDAKLTRQQRRFMEHPLFPLLLEVCAADAAGSIGTGAKERNIGIIADLYEETVAGEKR